MLSTRYSTRLLARIAPALVLLIALVYLAFPTRADVVILKDGTTLHGTLGKELTGITDPFTGDTYAISKVNALKFIDDGVRWTIFSDHRTRLGDVNKFNKFAELEVLYNNVVEGPKQKLPQAITFVKASDFDDKAVRVLEYRDLRDGGRYSFKQKVTVLSPHYVRLDCTNFIWRCFYSTQELGPEIVRKLIEDHPEMKEKDNTADLGKRSKKIRFFLQCRWFLEAEKDLKALETALPNEKEAVEKLRKEMKELQLELTVANLESAKKAGNYELLKKGLKALPKDLSAKLSLRVTSMDAEVTTLFKQFESTTTLLNTIKEKELEAPFLKAAAESILKEIHPDTASRLETFVVLAQQAENAEKNNKKVLHTPSQLLATAITGWLLGKNAAETNVDTARKLWESREVVIEFLRSVNRVNREALLKEYQTKSIPERAGIDELAQMIASLPPPDADPKPPIKPELRMSGDLPKIPGGVDYLVQVPPEYSHGRPYPLLVVCPNGNESLEETLKRFGDLPARHGYVIAVLRWNGNFRNEYHYTADERATVTGLIWHLRRRYQIDSDRVYLFGYGEGADLALDVGAGHPDLFAGVIPMAPRPSWLLLRNYWRNFQNTALYLISGDLVGDSTVPIRQALEHWMPRGYPVLGVLYKGRGNEWFGPELEHIFDWMPRQTRAVAMPSVGRSFGIGASDGDEYRSLRTDDDFFYWLSVSQYNPGVMLETSRSKNPSGAFIFGKIGEANHLQVRTRGVDQMSVWFGKGMIEFDKPIKVQWNGVDVRLPNKPMTAELSVMLDDLYQRGDRQRPFFTKIDLSLRPQKK